MEFCMLAGKHIGKEARAKWDFYLDDDQLLPIDGGRKRAMCVKSGERMISSLWQNG